MSFDALLAAILESAAVLGLLYLLVAMAFVVRLGWRRVPVAAAAPPVTIIKPLHGAEPGLYENLSSFCAQDYGGPVQLVFGVQHSRDPAIAVVARLREAYPALQIELVVDATMHGSNRKVSNLINMERYIRHEVVVLADSDMVVGPDYLARVVADLSRPGVGGVTCLYHGIAAGGPASRLAALAIDSHYLPSVAVGLGLGLAQPCFGSTIALRRDTLKAIGGFRVVADDLADDYLLGQAIRQQGLAVAVTPFTIGHVCAERSFRDLLRQEIRWVRTIRQIDPGGHAGSVLTHPLPLALLAFFIEPSLLAATLVLAAVGFRMGLCLAVERTFGLHRHNLRLVPLRDLLSSGVFLASFGGRAVSWRGHRYDVTSAGVLLAKDEALNPR